MKHLLFLLILATVFIAADCHKEGHDCHSKILFQNNSITTVVIARKINNLQNLSQCELNGPYVKSNNASQINFPQFSCIEDLYKDTVINVYVIDSTQFNARNIFYSCDSIEIKNKILKHYVLSLDDLKLNNFTITYP